MAPKRTKENADLPVSSKDLKSFRTQIDQLDLKILELINQRAELASRIGKVKSANNESVFSPAREEEVISNVLSANDGPLPEVTIRAIYREIISGSRALQKIDRVAYLGPEYSFSYLAALHRFGRASELVGVSNIAAVFEEVEREHVDYGVVPLENSTDGRVADTLDMFVRMPEIKICSEVRLRVHHNLLANGEQAEIRRVYSKPQALSQCRNWLAKNLPQASLHEVTSTTAAAEIVKTTPGSAAVASREAAVQFGLKILFTSIEDSPHNETRFAVIGSHAADRTGNDKTAIMFMIPHSPGALADILNEFKKNKVNMTWIESYPYPQAKGEYVFFVDFDGHSEDLKVKKTLNSLAKQCHTFHNLGSYPVASLVE
ncbi:MAG: prephenate dehydratase [Zavarzinella sp.]